MVCVSSPPPHPCFQLSLWAACMTIWRFGRIALRKLCGVSCEIWRPARFAPGTMVFHCCDFGMLQAFRTDRQAPHPLISQTRPPLFPETGLIHAPPDAPAWKHTLVGHHMTIAVPLAPLVPHPSPAPASHSPSRLAPRVCPPQIFVLDVLLLPILLLVHSTRIYLVPCVSIYVR